MSLIEVLGAVLSALAVWLTSRRSMICWPVSLTAAGLYCWIFLKARLYADAGLQIAFCLYVVYGWRHWQKIQSPDGRIQVRRPKTVAILKGLLSGATGSAVWAFILARFTNDPTPITDATLTAYSMLAQYWDTMRYRETWALWIVVDSAYVALFISRGLYPTAMLYAGFVILAAYGYRLWKPEASIRVIANTDM
ncbi:nicotinamide riboside transporter PnuC [Gluconobacter kanchanaburiensis]|uniref:Nicotinamide riboside transporter PnuC n=1 Tax=Gluconobacter kanchanaburiensis NBRC 103587 TaxID=1307948 RepID=A0A511BGQ3_9PROT|nr:nicotinamide riboside transporter PnuC [Gluconobacter kanchanaburiensis]MBF0862651.1 nicotinamide mononucleotide transporter [Gluconobacter kanchanaburiensis]GBR67555.1 transporter of nicotinamide mononucleotide PnuC [Gluconobacter kanchanaburiensis NBRC 103587]GEK96977.1 transporter [Gluconobacter kanchanaburiensis NBRC 103587]